MVRNWTWVWVSNARIPRPTCSRWWDLRAFRAASPSSNSSWNSRCKIWTLTAIWATKGMETRLIRAMPPLPNHSYHRSPVTLVPTSKATSHRPRPTSRSHTLKVTCSKAI
jgi:hypothetical protein